MMIELHGGFWMTKEARVPAPRDPQDELDPITEAQPVWSWQDDARELLKGGSQ